MIRDFSAQDIVSGSKTSNLRQLVEKQVHKQGKSIQEIRFREIRHQRLNLKTLKLKIISYSTSIGQEKFLQFITPNNQIVAFLRLSLPTQKPFIKELQSSVLIREIHVYGQALKIGETAQTQHLGLGTQLIDQAKAIAKKAGFKQLSVISAIGTKEYYRHRTFKDGQLYQHLKVD
jgi:elongator complex protein 3